MTAAGRLLLLVGLGALAALLAAVAATGPDLKAEAARLLAPPPRAAPLPPEDGARVPPGADLQAAIDAAPPGAALILSAGAYDGPLRITRPLVLWGPPDAVIRSPQRGSTIQARADDVALLGFAVDGSGGRFDRLDAAVRVEGDRIRVEGLRVDRALFGIVADNSNDVLIRGNHIIGTGGKALGMRGDGVRLFDTQRSRIEGNYVADARDVVVWYSSDNEILGNTIVRSRYGTHYMYSHGNRVEGNVLLDNTVGLFVMYSNDAVIESNLLARSRGAAGIGLGLKEAGNLLIRANRLLDNTTGIYIDTSPMQLDHRNDIAGNELRLNGAGIVFHGVAARNHVRGNLLQDNREQVRVEGRGDAMAAEWRGNAFDDYRGYDLTRDGYGDIPYELRSLTGTFIRRQPALEFFAGTPALALIDFGPHVLPLLQPRTLLRDPQPRMRLRAVIPDEAVLDEEALGPEEAVRPDGGGNAR